MFMTLLYGQNHLWDPRKISPWDWLEGEKTEDLCHVESGKIFFKHVPFYQQIEKIPTAHIFENLD